MKFKKFKMDVKNNAGILTLVVIGILMLSGSVDAGCVNGSTNYKCGDTITKSCVMNESLTMTGKGPCFIIGNDGIVIDGNGYSIIGNSGLGNMPINPMSGSINQNTLQDLSYGISTIDFSKINNPFYLLSIANGRSNVIIKNLTIRNFDIGILYYGSNSKIINNTIDNNSLAAIALIGSNNLIANNTINNTLLGNGLLSLSFSSLSLESNNNHVVNNTFENTLLGISLISLEKNTAKNNNVRDNFIRKNGIGIVLLSSTANIISDNIINQTLIGIAANDSTSNNIINNKANNGLVGIALNASTNNYIAYNNLTNNHIYSLFDFGDKGCNNVINNTGGDGKPIRYINNSIGINVSDTNKYAELIFCRVNDSLIDNVTITNSKAKSDGIVLVYSNNNKINNNNLNNDFIGIALSSSNNNNITHNTAKNNTLSGIALISSNNSNIDANILNGGIFKNALINSSLISIFIHIKGSSIYSNVNNINNNMANIVTNGLSGIYMDPALINTIVNSITNHKTFMGIALISSSNNNISNNTANNNGYDGIHLYSSSNNTLTHNTAKNNYGDGIHLYSSSNDTLTNNTVNNNNIGIYSKNSNSTINNNIVCGNTQLDFNSTDWLSSLGDNNTCDKPDGWNDTNAQNGGCKNKCPKYKTSACKEPRNVFNAVEMLEYLSGQENSTTYCDLNNDGRIDLQDVFVLMDRIVIERSLEA